jgi:glycosyltransferase involved in cell wall biosynthesis
MNISNLIKVDMIPNSLIDVVSYTPKFLQFPNSWVGHLPFAAWLIQEVSPTIFVELGTHSGNSYFSFCQAVAEAGISTKCYAVDTWQGDEHAGQCDEEVFAKVNAYHQEHYAGFSRLLRMTFDEALTCFEDGSINLLHIDGLHTYEAIRHDFDAWLPKLAPGAVVLFHATNVRERNFGVWKLWRELQANYPNNLEFVHSHGLGVLQLNNAPDGKRLEWLQSDSPEKQRLINYFASIGSRQLEIHELNELRLKVDNLGQSITQRDEHIAALNQAIAERDGKIANLKADFDRIVIVKNSEIRNLQQQLNQILHARSWRVMTPLRKAAVAIRQEVRSPRKSLLRKVAKSLLTSNPYFQNARVNAEVKAIRKSGLFDESYYLSMYPDLQPPPHDPIRHYCKYGWREGRNPSDDFDTSSYLTIYSDIRKAGMNPFYHYVIAGASEQRHAALDSGTRYENEIQFGVVDTDIKLLAFYSLPDWVALRSERSVFKGYSQALIPHEELGFYDPLDSRTLHRQAQMAKRHGLYGFCFDLDIGPAQPAEIFLANDDIDFRFCVQVGLHSEAIFDSLIATLVRAASDRRFICIEDRPVILVSMHIENRHAASALDHLRRQLADKGIDNPFLIGRSAQAGDYSPDTCTADLFDALLDLPSAPVPGETGDFLPRNKNGIDLVPYGIVASQGVARAQKTHDLACPLYHAVTFGRDNTAHGPERPLVYTRFHVKDYRRWLDAAIDSAKVAYPEDRRFVFVNAWNAWSEGLVIEPDRRLGFARLNETSRALLNISSDLPMPKVSVIVPNYNHELFLRRRLDSIYGQTYKNIEVILMDDCSSDSSRSLLDEYAAAHPDITCTLYNDKNSGSPFRQWAKGIKAATGDLVWIAESDDYCDERFLEVLVRCFDDEAVLLACARSTFVDRNEVPILEAFKYYLSDLPCAGKWDAPYVETAHNEVRSAMGIKNTIPNASGALFKHPIEMPLLDDDSWLSMTVAGDWVFYLHLIRGGKIAYSTETTNFFRRYEGSTAEATYKKEVFYREIGMASRTVASLYNVPLTVLEQCQKSAKILYGHHLDRSDEEFSLWYDYESVLRARESRLPNVMVSTMGFYPGGAEILPIRMANEFKRQGLSVILFSAGINMREDGVRRMLRNDVPVIETSSIEDMKAIIHDFGVEVLNSHQWYIQKYPLEVPDVFDELKAHVASLHGMIEHGNNCTEEELFKADQSVTTWVYTAEKNITPFSDCGLFNKSSSRFVKLPNGMQPPNIVPVSRADIGIPENAFVLCCVSRAIPDKGWAEMIQVVERARALSGRDIRLILVGNGPVYDEYCRIGAPDFVYLAGFSDNSVGHYAAADMGIMLTKFKSESFPLTIVDCFFAGKPYIASDVGDIRNMLTTADNVAGDVIELENWEIPIEKAAQIVAAFAIDKQKYMNALALVKEVANRYRIDVVASQYIRLFKSSCDEHRL